MMSCSRGRQVRLGGCIAIGAVVALWAGGCPRPQGTDAGDIVIDSGKKMPVCGNGILELGEQCDPPNGVDCDMNCQIPPPPPPPPPPNCGNSVIDPGEQCDPPDNVTCAPDCTLVTPGSVPVGGPCSLDSECMPGPVGTSYGCIGEADNDFPGGYCIIQDCTQLGDGSSNCPAGSTCELFGDGAGGTVTYCLATCTPSTSGNGGCRGDVAGNFAYACVPDLMDPITGYCFRGCENTAGCNVCESSGTCGNDSSVTCTIDADCTAAPVTWSCHTTLNLCYPDHPPGPAAIGDPCTSTADCPANAQCAGGDGTSATYPGGYCLQAYCDSYGSFPEFQCAGTSVCPSQEGFFAGVLQLCTAACTIDTASPDGECDGDRGDNYDYVCMETVNPVASLNELFDTQGAPGFCFQCEALFGTGTPECP